MSETAENSGEEAGNRALDVEAGEMTDGGEDDYDEEGSHHLVRKRGPGRRAVETVVWDRRFKLGTPVLPLRKLILPNYSWLKI